MGPLPFLAKSPLADEKGFVDVHKETLQHKKFANIFAIGDCTNLPTSKTAASIAGSNKILVQNLTNLMDGKTNQNVPKVCKFIFGQSKDDEDFRDYSMMVTQAVRF